MVWFMIHDALDWLSECSFWDLTDVTTEVLTDLTLASDDIDDPDDPMSMMTMMTVMTLIKVTSKHLKGQRKLWYVSEYVSEWVTDSQDFLPKAFKPVYIAKHLSLYTLQNIKPAYIAIRRGAAAT